MSFQCLLNGLIIGGPYCNEASKRSKAPGLYTSVEGEGGLGLGWGGWESDMVQLPSDDVVGVLGKRHSWAEL